MVSAWRETFADFKEVNIVRGNIIQLAENTIVSPANGYGYMDGGIDLVYSSFFGSKLNQKVQKAICRKTQNYLPVGSSIVIPTDNNRIPYMIVAPTMVLPEAIPARNCFYAMFAILQAVSKDRDKITEVYCPGLGTGVGCVKPKDAAREMAFAYSRWKSMDN